MNPNRTKPKVLHIICFNQRPFEIIETCWIYKRKQYNKIIFKRVSVTLDALPTLTFFNVLWLSFCLLKLVLMPKPGERLVQCNKVSFSARLSSNTRQKFLDKKTEVFMHEISIRNTNELCSTQFSNIFLHFFVYLLCLQTNL